MGEQSGMDAGLRVLSILIAGLIFYGGLGWLLDAWLHTSWCLPVGIVVGTAAGVYLVIAKYGRSV
ncbi:AtpZ/AtpI family protein [Propionicimonas sp.]|uniref:AtpZ/AtpI family protein n=1 Tax=Propionicimonas sp. TaxID=1955623 RepID=UPI0039E30A67